MYNDNLAHRANLHVNGNLSNLQRSKEPEITMRTHKDLYKCTIWISHERWKATCSLLFCPDRWKAHSYLNLSSDFSFLSYGSQVQFTWGYLSFTIQTRWRRKITHRSPRNMDQLVHYFSVDTSHQSRKKGDLGFQLVWSLRVWTQESLEPFQKVSKGQQLMPSNCSVWRNWGRFKCCKTCSSFNLSSSGLKLELVCTTFE